MFINYDKLVDKMCEKLTENGFLDGLREDLVKKLLPDIDATKFDVDKMTVYSKEYYSSHDSRYNPHNYEQQFGVKRVPLRDEIATQCVIELKDAFVKLKKTQILEELLERDLIKDLEDLTRSEIRSKIDSIVKGE